MKKSKHNYVLVNLLCIAALIFSSASPAFARKVLQAHAGLNEIKLGELRELIANDPPNPETLRKLDLALSQTEFEQVKVKSNLKYNSKHKRRFFRAAQWNIGKGKNIDDILEMLTSTKTYLDTKINTDTHPRDSKQRVHLKREIKFLKSADILILNETEDGLARSGYRNVTKSIADAMNAGYVFVPEFIEIDPKIINAADLNEYKFKGLHGNAIVSKFPIKNTQVIKLPKCYDWFDGEKKNLSLLESGKRLTAKITFDETVLTEVRHGNRTALKADVELPNGQDVTVIATHLEDRSLPGCRTTQLKAILETIKDNTNPVVFGGDFNSFELDNSPTAVVKLAVQKLKDVNFLGKTAISLTVPYAFIINAGLTALSTLRKVKDPTVKSVPIALPNRARSIFSTLDKFEFADGNEFDFSGEKKWSTRDRKGYLSNSNQRAMIKGFRETIKVKRSYKVIRFKIDWFFIKPLLKANEEKTYFPAFGRTLKDLNMSHLGSRLSDHNPITVDIMI